MLSWIAALAVGGLAWRLAYPLRRDRWATVAAACRGAAAALLTALLLDAPIVRAAVASGIVAIDGSASMGRTGDALWRAALDSARAIGGRLVLVDDSVRPLDRSRTAPPTGAAAAIGALVDATLRDGVPVTFVTDGELPTGTADLLTQLPAGSRTLVVPRPVQPDVAIDSLSIEEPVLAGDTLFARIGVRSGAARVDSVRLELRVGDAAPLTRPIAPLAPFERRTMSVAVALGAQSGDVVVAARVMLRGDTEPRNDSVLVRVAVTDQARAVVLVTSPDPDMRYALEAWRGALGERTRAYLRIAPGQWRDAATLTPVPEGQVRTRARSARTLILQGDTAWLGPFADVAAAGVMLIAPPPVPAPLREGEQPVREEWFIQRAPPSPISALLAGEPWDSLPPVVAGGAPAVAPGGGALLEAQLARRGVPRGIATWRMDGRRRVVVVAARGFASWANRGGSARDAHDAFWGGAASWLSDAPARGAQLHIAAGVVRADDPLVWSAPGAVSADTLVVRASDTTGGASRERRLPVVRDSAAGIWRTAGLPAGDYAGWIGRAVGVPAVRLAVNASAELLPTRPSVAAGPRVSAGRTTEATGLSRMAWAYVLVVLLLCMEWLARRQGGLR